MSVLNNKTNIDYLRISVTDRCNQRCVYCMPEEGILPRPQADILTFEEILRLVHIFASLGIKKIRLTGGEPLVRKGIIDLIKKINRIPAVEEICLTTNAVLLAPYADELRSAGVKKINISIDTLNRETFKKITRVDLLNDVFKGIEKAQKANFYAVKLNTVIMRHINDREIFDFMDFSLRRKLTLRFIEFMKVTPLWKEQYYMPLQEIKDMCGRKCTLRRLGYVGSSPAEYYRINEGGIIGFIKTDQNVCRTCSRLRLTSTGEMKICLYENRGVSLKDLMRNGIDNAELTDIIAGRMGMKKDINYKKYSPAGQYMCAIGG